MSVQRPNVRLPQSRTPAIAIWALMFLILGLALALRTLWLQSLPPGLFFDEGFYGLDALRSIRDNQWHVFYGANNGREPLFIYLAAASFAAFGASAWSLRLVSAISGVLAVALSYRFTRDLWRDRADSLWVAVFAGAAMSVEFWPVLLSRDAFRAFLTAPVTLFASWLLWRSHIQQTPRSAVLAGAVLGLSLYTYLSARMLPLAWAVFIGIELLAELQHKGWRRLWSSTTLRLFGLTTLSAVVVFSPLAAYFVLDPTTFLQRAGSVSILAEHPNLPVWRALLENILTVARMFIDHGDDNARHNFPGRAALDVLWAAAFWAGLSVCMVNWRRAAHRWLMIWLVVMLLPTILTTEAPHFLRSVGAIPPVMTVAGLGLWSLVRVFRLDRLGQTRLGVATTVLALVVSGAVTANDYFGRWATDPRLMGVLGFEVPISRAAAEVSQLAGTDDLIISARLFHHPAFRLLIEAHLQVAPGQWSSRDPKRPLSLIRLADEIEMSQPDVGRVGLWRDTDGAWRSAAIDAARPVSTLSHTDTIADSFGDPMFEITRNATDVYHDVAPDHVVNATVGEDVELWGYDLDQSDIRAGGTVAVTLYWRSLAFANQDYTVFTQLQALPDHALLAQNDTQPVNGASRTTLWRPGEVVVDRYAFTLPDGVPAGKIAVIAGLYEPVSHNRLPVRWADGPVTFDHIDVGVVTVVSDAAPVVLTEELHLTAGDPGLIVLEGIALPTRPVIAGTTLDFSLFWRSQAIADRDYTVFVHLLSSDGAIVAQADAQPQGGRSPTTLWRLGEAVMDQHSLSVPGEVAPGRYRLSFGLYDSATGQRLPWFDSTGNRQPDDRIILETPIEISAP